MQGLDRLSKAERQVLLLLSEGHTAKSIATTLGATEAAVNERLREARRKTGVGSSRELARLLKAQENRDNLIGVARVRRAGPIISPPGAEPWRPQNGVLAMMSFLLVAAAGAAAMMSQAPVVSNTIDPLIGEPLRTSPDPAALHARVRSERRDPEWAPRVESAVRARLLQMPVIGKEGNALRVICATELCELAGTITWPDPLPKEGFEDLPQNQAQHALQDVPLADDLAKLGLKSEAGLFTGGKGKPERSVFLLYYLRTDGKQ